MRITHLKTTLTALDKRTVAAIVLALILPAVIRPFVSQIMARGDWHNFFYQWLVKYRILWLTSGVLLIVCLVERQSPLSLGLGLPALHRGLPTTLLGSVVIVLVAFLVGTFWHWAHQLRLEGDRLYFIGNTIPVGALTPSVLYFLDYEQLLIVTFPEELLYRGYLQSRLSYTFRPAVAIVGAAVLFSLAHADRPLMFVHLAVIAPLLGIAYHFSKSIWPGVIIHYVANTTAPLIFKWIVLH